MPKYVSVDSLKAFKIDGQPGDFCDYDDDEIGDQIDVAENIVEAITGNIFNAFRATLLLDGNGLQRLFFIPAVSYKLLEVSSLRNLDLDGTTVLDTYTENVDYKQYNYYVEVGTSFHRDSPRRQFGRGGVWPKGQKNIDITGVWSYDTPTTGVVSVTVVSAPVLI